MLRLIRDVLFYRRLGYGLREALRLARSTF